MRYVEFCAGIGGMRAGLDAAGWECVFAVDNDPDAAQVHELAHGDIACTDIASLAPKDIPIADAWVAGFPCQPFSSSGNRNGFGHASGNVFEKLMQLADACAPSLLVLENVEGLLTNKGGHTMSMVLKHLTNANYSVDWMMINSSWLGVAQTRPRLFMICAQPRILKARAMPDAGNRDHPRASAFAPLVQSLKLDWKLRTIDSISSAEERLRPRIGKAQPKPPYIYGGFGRAVGDSIQSENLLHPNKVNPLVKLSDIVAPDFPHGDKVRSVRYWTTNRGKGPTKAYVRKDPISHCIGSSIGGAPLFSAPISTVKKQSDRDSFLQYSNWYREQDGLLVMRLRPHYAVPLFGPDTESIAKAIDDWPVGDTRKYKLVGNMVSPVCAKEVAMAIAQQIEPMS